MTARQYGVVRLDAKRRISVGSYTELEPGDYYRVERDDRGVLTLTPAFARTQDGRRPLTEKDCE